MNLNTYISHIEGFLGTNTAIDSDNIELNLRRNSEGNVIAMNFIEKRKVQFKEGYDLILNSEMGHVVSGDYNITNYNYHYNDPVEMFRFENKGSGPHINDKDGTHWFYDDDVDVHNKDLKRDITKLNTKMMNFFLMLHICKDFINLNLYPTDPESCDHYEEVVSCSADTAIVASGSFKRLMFSPFEGMEIKEIICKPRNLTMTRKGKYEES